MSDTWREWRCEKCGKLLGKFEEHMSGSIKCPRCNAMNVRRATAAATLAAASIAKAVRDG